MSRCPQKCLGALYINTPYISPYSYQANLVSITDAAEQQQQTSSERGYDMTAAIPDAPIPTCTISHSHPLTTCVLASPATALSPPAISGAMQGDTITAILFKATTWCVWPLYLAASCFVGAWLIRWTCFLLCRFLDRLRRRGVSMLQVLQPCFLGANRENEESGFDAEFCLIGSRWWLYAAYAAWLLHQRRYQEAVYSRTVIELALLAASASVVVLVVGTLVVLAVGIALPRLQGWAFGKAEGLERSEVPDRPGGYVSWGNEWRDDGLCDKDLEKARLPPPRYRAGPNASTRLDENSYTLVMPCLDP